MQQADYETLVAVDSFCGEQASDAVIHKRAKSLFGESWGGELQPLAQGDGEYSPMVAMRLGRLHRMGLVVKRFNKASQYNNHFWGISREGAKLVRESRQG